MHRLIYFLLVNCNLFIGTIADSTGDYRGAFFLAGIVMCLSGAICFPLRRILKWESRRTSARKRELRDSSLPTDLDFDVI